MRWLYGRDPAGGGGVGRGSRGGVSRVRRGLGMGTERECATEVEFDCEWCRSYGLSGVEGQARGSVGVCAFCACWSCWICHPRLRYV